MSSWVSFRSSVSHQSKSMVEKCGESAAQSRSVKASVDDKAGVIVCADSETQPK